MTYDRYDRVTKQIQSGQTAMSGSFSSHTVTNTYDQEHNLTRVTQTATPDPKGIGSLTRYFTFDGVDRQLSEGVGYPAWDDELFRWTYDAAGNLVTGGRDAIGVTLTYDAANRLQTRDGDNAATFTYAKTGGIATADNSAAKVKRTYYPNGALETDSLTIAMGMVTPDLSIGETYGLRMTYDRSGRRTQLSYPSSVASVLGAASYSYDPQSGALDTVTDWLGATYRYGYDAAGRIKTFTWRSGQSYTTTETRGYDIDSRMTSRVVQQGSQTLQSDSLAYDPRGKVVRVSTDTFTYDGRGRTTYSRYGAVEETFSLDGFGNIMHRDGIRSAPSWGDYVYEPYRGRLTGQSSIGSQGHNDTTQFGYDDVGNQLGRISLVEGLMNTGAGTMLITFRSSIEDEYSSANQLELHRLTWDTVFAAVGAPNFNSALTSVYKYVSTERYRYDALGRRVWVGMQRDSTCRRDGSPELSTGCATTERRVVWDGAQILAEVQSEDGISAPNSGLFSGTVTYTHGLGIDQPLTMTRSGYAVQIIPSWHGGVEVICTPGCTMSATLPSRSTFGPMTGGLSAWYGSLVTSGQDASGYLYRRNRYLDPKVGRFTQEDPIGLAGGMNLYGFGGGDPVNYTDPFGLMACPPDCGFEGDPKNIAREAARIEALKNASAKEIAGAVAIPLVAAAGGVGIMAGTAGMAASYTTAEAISAGLVRAGGKLAGVLTGIEAGFGDRAPRTALDALGVVSRAATRVGLEAGVLSKLEDGSLQLKIVGGIVTTLQTNGGILVQRGKDTLLRLQR